MANKKEFKPAVYGVFAGIIVAVVLVALTIFAFTTRYTALAPEKVAISYADTIAQTGDGYNAYKQTLVSKNQKFGDFVINAYMRPFVNDGKDVKKSELIGTGSAEETAALDTIYNDMYEVYCGLIETVGLDDYDTFYNTYFEALKQKRAEVLGDDFMNTEFMFGVFEANVATYGEDLTGCEEQLAADKKTVLKEAKTGKYQETFGKDYKLVTTASSTEEITGADLDAYIAGYKERIEPIAAMGEAKAVENGIEDVDKKHQFKTGMINAYASLDCSNDISAVSVCTVDVKTEDGKDVASAQIYVVKIGNSWYVDNTNTDTSSLYIVK